MSRAGTVAIALAVALAGACRGDGGDAPRFDTSVLDTLAPRIADAFCGWQFRCCTAIEITVLESSAYTTEEQCRQAAAWSYLRTELAVFAPSVASGALTVDEAAAGACIDQYRVRACNPLRASSAAPGLDPGPHVAGALACPGVLVGHVPNGGTCRLGLECAAGLRCVTPGNGTAPRWPDRGAGPELPEVTYGRCQADGGPGARCFWPDECDPGQGLYCRGADLVCARPSVEGEGCLTNPSATVLGQIACDTEQKVFCDLLTGRCRHLPRVGEPCAQFLNSGPATCDPDPALGLLCIGRTCLPAGGEGDACGASLLPPCRNGFVCRPTQPDGIGACGAPPVIGEPCGPSGECGAGACDLAVRMCEAPGGGGVGATCASNTDCASLVCDTVVGIGQTCGASPVSPVCVGNGTTPALYSPMRPLPDAGSRTPPDAGAPPDAAAPESGTIGEP